MGCTSVSREGGGGSIESEKGRQTSSRGGEVEEEKTDREQVTYETRERERCRQT
jgi:hypothetical protein